MARVYPCTKRVEAAVHKPKRPPEKEAAATKSVRGLYVHMMQPALVAPIQIGSGESVALDGSRRVFVRKAKADVLKAHFAVSCTPGTCEPRGST